MSKESIVRAGAEAAGMKLVTVQNTEQYRTRYESLLINPRCPTLPPYIASVLRSTLQERKTSGWVDYPWYLTELNTLPAIRRGQRGWPVGSCAFANDCQRIAAALVALGEWTLEQAKEEFDETS